MVPVPDLWLFEMFPVLRRSGDRGNCFRNCFRAWNEDHGGCPEALFGSLGEACLGTKWDLEEKISCEMARGGSLPV